MNYKIKREDFSNWWRFEGKIEVAAAAVVFLIVIAFWGNLLVEGVLGITIALWCLVKIYFKPHQWAFLMLCALWVLSQGISALLQYMKS